MNARFVLFDIVAMGIFGWVFKKEFDTYRLGKRYHPSENAINLFIVIAIGIKV